MIPPVILLATALALVFAAADRGLSPVALMCVAVIWAGGLALASDAALYWPRLGAAAPIWTREEAPRETVRAAALAFLIGAAPVALWSLVDGVIKGGAIWSGAGAGTVFIDWTLSVAVFGAAAILAAGVICAVVLRVVHGRGGLRERVLLVGDPGLIDRARHSLRDHHADRIDVVAAAADWKSRTAPDMVARLVRERRISLILCPVDGAKAPLHDAREVFHYLGAPCADVAVFDLATPTVATAIVARTSRPSIGQRAWKRLLDVVGASICLLLLSPVLLITAALVKSSPGPIFFMQPRTGLNGRTFHIFKFRTMYHDRTDLEAAQQTRDGDPRITSNGVFLRKYCLDELPQLLNILRGDMSLIGPRPHAPGMRTEGKLCEEIVRGYAIRHLVKPGMTGFAQVHGERGPVHDGAQLQRRVDFDETYIRQFSLWMDIRVALSTLPVVVKAENSL